MHSRALSLVRTGVSSNPDLHICRLSEETGVLGENPAGTRTFNIKGGENPT